jgi:hypothetical protein
MSSAFLLPLLADSVAVQVDFTRRDLQMGKTVNVLG